MTKRTAFCARGFAAALLLAALSGLAGSLSADDGSPQPAKPPAAVAEALEPATAPEPIAQYQGNGTRPDLSPQPVYPPTGGTMGAGMAPVEWSPYPVPAPESKTPLQPFKVLFFDNDYSFLSNPDHEYIIGERLKNMDVRAFTIGHMQVPDLTCDDPEHVEIREFLPLSRLPDPTRLSFGGELRFRQMDESNRLRPGGPARGDYQLWRWRNYLDLNVSDWLRVYGEGIDASMDNNPLPVTGIDVNRWDLQNLFVDLRLWSFDDDDDRPIWFRAGRQELLYGSQRLVSPFDWANTRRNFEGLKVFTRGSDWDFDVWFTRTVNTATFGDGPVSLFASHFDSPNMNHAFSGAWFTYKAIPEHLVDLYWLWDWNSKFIQPNFQGGNRHTVASRWLGNFPAKYGDSKRTWHGEIEGGYQFGSDFGNKDVSAGFIVTGLGHTWNQLPWQPDFWVYYDWASGSSNLNGRTTNTFDQQHGLRHAFLGQIDNIARQNIRDINTKLTVKPLPNLAVQTQHHWFDLADGGDVLYTITGVPFGKPHTGTHVGNELDLVATYTFNPNFNVQIGYFRFWYGEFVENNSPRGNADELYIQTTMTY